MSIRSDQKALVFLGVVGVLGAGVRVVRTASGEQAPAVQPALERQAHVADSAAAAQRQSQGSRGGRKTGRGRGGRVGRVGGDAGDTRAGQGTSAGRTPPTPAKRNGPGYIGGKLDLDVATAEQIDSLPGVTPLMARRIATDRVRRGPFLNLNGLRRVSGAGQLFLQKIDTLVTFSGTLPLASPGDTIVKSRKKKK